MNAPLPKVYIVGAGCSGFTTAKRLQDLGVPFDCFEMSDDVGGNWYFKNPNGAPPHREGAPRSQTLPKACTNGLTSRMSTRSVSNCPRSNANRGWAFAPRQQKRLPATIERLRSIALDGGVR